MAPLMLGGAGGPDAPPAAATSSGGAGAAGASANGAAPALHEAGSGAQPAVVLDTAGPGAGVAALTLNRDHLAVAGTDGSVHVFSLAPVAAAGAAQGPPAFSHEVWLGRSGSTGVAVASADCGGPDHGTLLMGCPDGTLYRAAIAPHAGAGVGNRGGYTLAAPLADFPVGRLAGVVAHPGGGAFLTAGADGSVRVWGALDGALLAKKALSSAQCALAAASPGAGLAAVGSETGVVRVLVLPPPPYPDAVVGPATGGVHRLLLRLRLLCDAPANDLLLSAGRDGSVWLLALDARSGSCRALGHVSVPAGERVLAVAWPRVADADESCLLSLAGGGLMCVSVSPELSSGNWRNPRPDCALLAPPAATASRALGSESGDGGGGGGGAAEPVVVKLLRLEVPLLAVASAPGERYGDLYGLGADKHLHKLVPPSEAAAWAGLRARPHRSTLHVTAHGRPGGGVAVTPAGHMVVTGAADGSVSLRNMALQVVADGGGGAGLHDVTAGGVAAVSFDATGRYFASAGADGALFVYEVGGAAAAAAHLMIPPPATVPYMPFSAGRVEPEEMDEPGEATEVELQRRAAAASEADAAGGESRRAAVEAKLGGLRQRIAELMAANGAAPELERLDKGGARGPQAVESPLLWSDEELNTLLQ
ncbi:hypothetical protein TSOC_014626, partial [Tetrabaena socialis]